MITRETFEKLPEESKLNALYDISVDTYNEVKDVCKKIESNKKTDTTLSALFGFIGGLVAVLGSKIFRG